MPKVCHDVDTRKGSAIFDTNPSGWRKCLVSFSYPMSEYMKLPQHVAGECLPRGPGLLEDTEPDVGRHPCWW